MPDPDFLAQILARRKPNIVSSVNRSPAPTTAPPASVPSPPASAPPPVSFDGAVFRLDAAGEAFAFDFADASPVPRLVPDAAGRADVDVAVPLAPCAYRLTDYTLAKRQPVSLRQCVSKLGQLRCLARERDNLNALLRHRLRRGGRDGTLEEEELGKTRFMEMISSCGVFQKVSDLICRRAARAAEEADRSPAKKDDDEGNPYRIPQVRVEGLEEFLAAIEEAAPSLRAAREEISKNQTVSFYPGLGELFRPGVKLACHPEGMEGSPLGCSCVQSWYAEETNPATGKIKRRFILCVEFIVSVGEELVFVAASDVYPEFHDVSRSVPIKDLNHRVLNPDTDPEDALFVDRLRERGEFYASVATQNHYLRYDSDSFFPIIGGGWNSNAARPLSKGGRVMVDVARGILEGHVATRGKTDGMADAVKEATRLYEQNKRTGIAVPFRTVLLPDALDAPRDAPRGDSDRTHLWQAWPMLTGFSFTARVWGKLLLAPPRSPSRPAAGAGRCGNVGYIRFQERAFDQLVLAEDKKELIRAVARHAGARDPEDSDDDDAVLDVVADKGAASIFLLHGPPGCGKTLTAEAIAELLRKPLYVVTAGDLGITAAEVEKSLGAVLDLCQTWDALVLVDEADVFLEARGSTEIQRNALVCVMLRLLEYYSGCLFLSSNRKEGSIDAAIASRITVMLGYPPLDDRGRAKVWRNLIGLVPPPPEDPETGEVPGRIADNPRKISKYRDAFSEEDYDGLGSRFPLNGRQIKNSIVLARALARERGVLLSLPILERAVAAVAGECSTV